MASRKIQTYQNKANNLYTVYFVFDSDGEYKFIKTNIIVITEILDGCAILSRDSIHTAWHDKDSTVLPRLAGGVN